ncbi:MAG: hypothetical protein J6C08_00125 [Campylobacter sp.]|uniref:phage tail protein n=1 Tax=Campylobacter sp. TaxID=205 RepID=UPI001B27ADD2|nr:hypothetical protein [Campylobacter sp.]MBO5062906.1 hypothetical protein [Campylobacter sp.]
MNDSGLKIKISLATEELRKGIDNAKKQVNSFKEQVAKASKNVDDNFKAIGQGINGALKGVGVAVGAAAASLVALGASTTEYRNEQAKLVSAFESAGAGADTAKNTYNDLFRVLGDSGQAVEAANHLGKLTTEEKALSEWTNICQGVYAEFGDSLALEGLTEAVNHTAKLGEVQGTLADALEWSGVNVDTFNESLSACNTEAEREKLIRETLSGMYSESAANYEKNNAQLLAQNEAQARLQETTAKLGEKMQPVITAFTNFANDALAAVMPYISDLADKAVPKLQEVLEKAGESTGKIMGFITDNWDIIVTIAAIIGGITTAIGLYNVVAAIKAAMAAAEVTTVWGLVAAYTAQAAAMIVALAPYLLIVAAIAAVIAIIVLCVKHWDTIKEATAKAFEAIKNAVQVAIDFIIGLFQKIISWVLENWQGLLLFLVNPFAGAFKLIYDNCEGFRNFIDNLVKVIRDFFVVTLWENGIKKAFSSVGTFFKDVFQKGADGIKKAFSSIGSFFSGVWSNIKNIFSSVGSAIATGITGAVKGAVNKVLSFATNTINKFISAINAAIGIINAIPGVNIRKLSKLSVPQLAKGGIVDSATLAVIGERGKEAVVPLENNTEWLDMLEARLNKGSNQPIILQVDGKTFAQIAVSSINDLTTLTGSLPLKLA